MRKILAANTRVSHGTIIHHGERTHVKRQFFARTTWALTPRHGPVKRKGFWAFWPVKRARLGRGASGDTRKDFYLSLSRLPATAPSSEGAKVAATRDAYRADLKNGTTQRSFPTNNNTSSGPSGHLLLQEKAFNYFLGYGYFLSVSPSR